MPSIKQLYNRFGAKVNNVVREFQKRVNGTCAVLLYHRIENLKTDPQLLAVSPLNFELQLSHLKENYTVLSVGEFKDCLLKGKRFPQKSVMLTFDDGYADNYYYAMPALEKHKLQALFYVSTGCLNASKEFWWDELERIILLNEYFPDNFNSTLKGIRLSETQFRGENRADLYSFLLTEFRKLLTSEREKKMNELAHLFRAPGPRRSHRAMSYGELLKFSQSASVVIGAHTFGHPSLANISFEEQWKEIFSSKRELEEILNKNISDFSFPFGTVNDYNNETLKICKELNFDMVAANYPDLVFSRSCRFDFPRFLVRDWDKDTFESKLESFFS